MQVGDAEKTQAKPNWFLLQDFSYLAEARGGDR
jgi:hypothetical protein